jgi:hypothetical protein
MSFMPVNPVYLSYTYKIAPFMPLFHVTLTAHPTVLFILPLLHILVFFRRWRVFSIEAWSSYFLFTSCLQVCSLCRCSAFFDYCVKLVSYEHGNVD